MEDQVSPLAPSTARPKKTLTDDSSGGGKSERLCSFCGNTESSKACSFCRPHQHTVPDEAEALGVSPRPGKLPVKSSGSVSGRATDSSSGGDGDGDGAGAGASASVSASASASVGHSGSSVESVHSKGNGSGADGNSCIGSGSGTGSAKPIRLPPINTTSGCGSTGTRFPTLQRFLLSAPVAPPGRRFPATQFIGLIPPVTPLDIPIPSLHPTNTTIRRPTLAGFTEPKLYTQGSDPIRHQAIRAACTTVTFVPLPAPLKHPSVPPPQRTRPPSEFRREPELRQQAMPNPTVRENEVGREGRQNQSLRQNVVGYGAGQNQVSREYAVGYGASQHPVSSGNTVGYGAGQNQVLRGNAVAYGARQNPVLRENAVGYGARQNPFLTGNAVYYGAEQNRVLRGTAVGHGAGQNPVLRENAVGYVASRTRHEPTAARGQYLPSSRGRRANNLHGSRNRNLHQSAHALHQGRETFPGQNRHRPAYHPGMSRHSNNEIHSATTERSSDSRFVGPGSRPVASGSHGIGYGYHNHGSATASNRVPESQSSRTQLPPVPNPFTNPRDDLVLRLGFSPVKF